MRTILASLQRAAVIYLVPLGFLRYFERGMGASADADIGGGAIAMVLVLVVAGVWAYADARRRSFPDLLRLWLLVVATGAVVAAVRSLVRDGVTVDLAVLPVVDLVLVGVPAVIGGAVGQTRGAVRPARSS